MNNIVLKCDNEFWGNYGLDEEAYKLGKEFFNMTNELTDSLTPRERMLIIGIMSGQDMNKFIIANNYDTEGICDSLSIIMTKFLTLFSKNANHFLGCADNCSL